MAGVESLPGNVQGIQMMAYRALGSDLWHCCPQQHQKKNEERKEGNEKEEKKEEETKKAKVARW